ncbi:MAG: VanW family protein, partial [Chloroflexota bacterium]|nr:VanW family protein [Chloroflexota bacterium]
RVATTPRDGAVRFVEGKVETTPAVPGRELDRARAATALRGAFLSAQGPVSLPARAVAPRVPQSEVARAVTEFAVPAVAAPVTLVVGSAEVSISPSQIGSVLTMAPDASGRLQPNLDGPKLKKLLAKTIEVERRNATFRIVQNRPQVVPSRQGRAVDAIELGTAVLAALPKTGDARIATVQPRLSYPEVTTEEVQALGIRQLVSEYTTYYPSDFRPRLINIHRAADYMDNTLVLPGETFSLNAEVGERTRARGFAEGYVISNGKLAVDYGGGVSQLATTTFNAAFFAGLEDVEHHPHSFYISRYPEGREATIVWGSKDLRFRNDSGYGVFITTSYTNSSVTVRMYGTKIYRVEATKSPRYAIKGFKTLYDPRPQGPKPGECVEQEGVVGFQVVVTREFYLLGTRGAPLRTQRFHTVYQPEDRVICGSMGPPRGT